VEKFTRFALLAETAQPVLTDEVIDIRVAVRGRMPVWTGGPEGAVALEVGLACWAVWGEAVAVGLEEERRKRELVLRGLVLENLAGEVFRTRAPRQDG